MRELIRYSLSANHVGLHNNDLQFMRGGKCPKCLHFIVCVSFSLCVFFIMILLQVAAQLDFEKAICQAPCRTTSLNSDYQKMHQFKQFGLTGPRLKSLRPRSYSYMSAVLTSVPSSHSFLAMKKIYNFQTVYIHILSPL